MPGQMTVTLTGKRLEEFNEAKAVCALMWPAEREAMSNARVLSVAMQALKTCYTNGIEVDHRWHDGRVSQGTTADLIATMERLRGVNSNGE